MKKIHVDHQSITKAVTWFREQYDVPIEESIIKEFQEEFNCEVIMDKSNFSVWIEFESESDYNWFILRWS